MRFGEQLNKLAVAEWKQCYVDYQHLKILVLIIYKIINLIEKQNEVKKQQIKSTSQNVHFIQIKKVNPQTQINLQNETNRVIINTQDQLNQSNNHQVKQSVKILQHLMQKANKNFYKLHFLSITTFQKFFHMKYYEMKQKFLYYCQMSTFPLLSNPRIQINIYYLNLLEENYIETSYLLKMYEIVVEGERKILKKHKKNVNDLISTPQVYHKKINRIYKLLHSLKDDMQDHYIKFNNLPSKESRAHLRSLAEDSKNTVSDSFFFGFFIGFAISVTILIAVMLSYQNVSLISDQQKSKDFTIDFPTWRGVAFFILYVWILGINIWAYQSYCVNHKLIFKFFDHHCSTSTQILQVAGLLSTIFLIFFLLYALLLSGIAIKIVSIRYLVLFAWGSLLIYIFMPLPIFNHRGRIYVVKLLMKCIAAPFLGVTFPIIFATDQIISLITPIKDMVYTGCYYTVENASKCSDSNMPSVVLIISTIVYSLRIFQCIKQGYDSGEFICTLPFYNTLKYSFSLLTVVLSYVYKSQNPNIFAAWIVSAAISTLYSYIWDLKVDWALFEDGAKYRFLRKYITFGSPYNYYFVMVANFLLRLAWVLTSSPNIVASFGNPQLFTLVTGGLEIIRRGLWNLLRVQRQHLSNCGNFKAFPDVTNIQKRLQQCLFATTNTSMKNLISKVLGKKKKTNEILKDKHKLLQHTNLINQFYPNFKKTINQSLFEIQILRNQIKEFKKQVKQIINNIQHKIQVYKKNK